MPELPEAETIAAGLRNCLIGKKIKKVTCRTKSLRRPLSQRKLNRDCAETKIIAVTRRGKAIIVQLSNNKAIIIQLGMTGACRVCPTKETPLKHEHVLFELSGNKSWRYEDARRFGMVESYSPDNQKRLPIFLKNVGPEPFSDEFSGEYLFEITRKRSAKIKEILLNQQIVAGIGNIYVSEILFRAGIHPARQANKLTLPDCRKLVKYTRTILQDAITAGGTTISDYKDVNGEEGKFTRELQVYGHAGEKCNKCKTPIATETIGGRSTFYCPECQKH
jgi:formamidopyrimidine-DNA glycosylase